MPTPLKDSGPATQVTQEDVNAAIQLALQSKAEAGAADAEVVVAVQAVADAEMVLGGKRQTMAVKDQKAIDDGNAAVAALKTLLGLN